MATSTGAAVTSTPVTSPMVGHSRVASNGSAIGPSRSPGSRLDVATVERPARQRVGPRQGWARTRIKAYPFNFGGWRPGLRLCEWLIDTLCEPGTGNGLSDCALAAQHRLTVVLGGLNEVAAVRAVRVAASSLPTADAPRRRISALRG